MSLEKVVIISGVRTPIGRFGGALQNVHVSKLAAIVLNEVIKRGTIEAGQVDEVVMASAYQNGECANGARFAVLEAGWPETVPGITIDRRCCGGLDAISLGAMKIQTGNANIIVAGGMESMSQAEMYLPGYLRWGLGGITDEKWGFMPRGHGNLAMWGIPFFDRISRARVMSQPIARYGELNSMMAWAETAAKQEGITRLEADKWALRSHRKACAAMASGIFAQEIVPVPIESRKGGPTQIEIDETPRADTTLEGLQKLKPVYHDGVCTAGNSSSENDGAAAVLLMSERKARELRLKPLAVFTAFAAAATNPTLTYPAVPAAVNKALDRAGIRIDEVGLIEIQEAFAVQALADARLMGLKEEECEVKVNVNGSGISLGHPVGATGVMRFVTLAYEMARRGTRYGLETICGGGGLGVAAVIEKA